MLSMILGLSVCLCSITSFSAFALIDSPNPITVQASNILTEADAIAEIKLVFNDQQTSLEIKIPKIEQYLQVATTEQWIDAMFKAYTAKLELFIKYDRLKDAEKILLDSKKGVYEQLDTKQKIQFKRYELYVADALSQSEVITNTRNDLLNYVEQMTNFKSEKDLYLGLVYLALGQSYTYTLESSKAIQSYQKAFTHLEKIDSFENLTSVLNSLGTLYTKIDNPSKAIEYFNKSLEIQTKLDNPIQKSIIWYNLSSAYQKMDDFEMARETLVKSRAISVELNDKIGVAWCDQSLALIELQSENYERALALLENTIPVFANEHGAIEQYEGLLGAAKAWLGLKDLDKAEYFFNRSEALYQQIKNPEIEFERSVFIAKLNNAQGKYSNILNDLMHAIDVNKKMFEAEKLDLVEKYRIEFDTQYQESRNQELLENNALSEQVIHQQEHQQKLWIIVIICCFICIAVIAVFLVKQNKLRKEFKALAFRDPLTNQPNRRCILNSAEHALNSPSNRSLVIAIIDIDFFKKTNDRFGHDTGDSVLKAFGETCKSAIRAQDSFGRYGGEEWLLALEDINEHSLHELFKRIFKQVNAKVIDGFPRSERITFSMGAVILKDRIASSQYKLSELISMADEQLYAAKDQGRNRLLYKILE